MNLRRVRRDVWDERYQLPRTFFVLLYFTINLTLFKKFVMNFVMHVPLGYSERPPTISTETPPTISTPNRYSLSLSLSDEVVFVVQCLFVCYLTDSSAIIHAEKHKHVLLLEAFSANQKRTVMSPLTVFLPFF